MEKLPQFKFKAGDVLKVYHYIPGRMLTVTAIGPAIYQDENWELPIKFENGDQHYCWFDVTNQRWEVAES